MDKTIGTKLPEEEGEVLEKIAAERKESVSVFVRNLIREAIEKNGKVEGAGEDRLDEILTILRTIEASKPGQDSVLYGDPETTKKLDEIMKILSGFQPTINDQTKKLWEKISLIPKADRGTDSHLLLLESLELNTRELCDLKPEIERIRGTTGIDVSFKNPEFWKKSLAVARMTGLFLGMAIFAECGWFLFQKGEENGIARSTTMISTIDSLLKCEAPGWKIRTTKEGRACYPFSAKDGVHGWKLP